MLFLKMKVNKLFFGRKGRGRKLDHSLNILKKEEKKMSQNIKWSEIPQKL